MCEFRVHFVVFQVVRDRVCCSLYVVVLLRVLICVLEGRYCSKVGLLCFWLSLNVIFNGFVIVNVVF